jgi:alpha-N-arabinofuranosidase
MAVNLGTRGIQEALDLLEYCNAPTGTALADLRSANGRADPYRVRRWCLGNEMDGPWQIGHKTAHEYGRLAAETARAMRMADPGLILTACGSSGPDMTTFGEWEATVLGLAYDEVDLISAHCYFFEQDADLASFLASGVRLDAFLEAVAATADHVGSVRKSAKRIDIALDEWNVWYMNGEASRSPTGDEWPVAPRLLEDRYSVADAVVVGALLISVLRHADRVAAANLAQLVNVIAPIMTEPGGPAWRQTTFHPFALTSQLADGVVLASRIVADRVETARYGEVDALDAVATWDPERGRLAVFAVNRSPDSVLRLHVDARGLGPIGSVVGQVLADPDPYRVPGRNDPGAVSPKPLQVAVGADSSLLAELPAASWAVLEYRPSTV